MTFLIKICGVTRPEDAALACAEGADAIGLNFWRGSKRFVADDRAREIIAATPPGVLKIGVFVNPHPLIVTETVAELKLDIVQFHGDEHPESWSSIPGNQMIRAIRVFDQTSLTHATGWNPRYFLYDSFADGYGGAGLLAPWRTIAAGARRPFLLAGGLGPQNVAEAIAAVRPDGVDVASGVESKPGIKDKAKLAAFIANARSAAAKLLQS
jgi:phosphoribosylanthranilate isomerase